MAFPAEVHSVVIFGSCARGDTTDNSDLDVAVFSQDDVEVSKSELVGRFPALDDGRLSLACYGESSLDKMLRNGSLFLWHIKNEGKIIYGEDYLVTKLILLEPFERHDAEISNYLEMLADLFIVNETSCEPNEFDLALLFTIVRNTCMILTHKAGSPDYGRTSCYYTAGRMYQDFPFQEKMFLELEHWKAVYGRGTTSKVPLPTEPCFCLLMERVKDLLEYAYVQTQQETA